MKLTDEAYERATDAISTLVESWPASASPPFHPDLGVRGTMRALAIYALEAAALPHLTDDGAAAPPADSTGVGAPAAAESATTTAAPSSPHRPTCGTTYGESCDGYCPTPAIDREALQGRLDQLWGWAKAGKQRDPHDPTVEYYLMDAENVDAFTRHVLELIEGAQ